MWYSWIRQEREAPRIFLDAVSRMKPDSIVYISCNPETLKRDLEILVKKDWKVEMIQGVDLFPGTKHTEVVCSLQRLHGGLPKT